MEFIGKLAENGIVALLLAISLIALYYLFTKYQEQIKFSNELQEKRIAEYTEMKDAVMELLRGIKSTTDSTLITLQSLGKSGKGE